MQERGFYIHRIHSTFSKTMNKIINLRKREKERTRRGTKHPPLTIDNPAESMRELQRSKLREAGWRPWGRAGEGVWRQPARQHFWQQRDGRRELFLSGWPSCHRGGQKHPRVSFPRFQSTFVSLRSPSSWALFLSRWPLTTLTVWQAEIRK